MDYAKLYALFENTTPLKADCGEICGRACCRGDENTGMLLFPGEKTPFEIKEKNGVGIAVCGGECRRCDRPLSCRIFPLFPLEKNGKIFAVPDMRGYGVCPLVKYPDKVLFSRKFILAVIEAGKILYADEECAEFCRGIAEDIKIEEKLKGIFG